MELVDVRDSKSRGPRGRVGSTPTSGTNRLNMGFDILPVSESLAFLFLPRPCLAVRVVGGGGIDNERILILDSLE